MSRRIFVLGLMLTLACEKGRDAGPGETATKDAATEVTATKEAEKPAELPPGCLATLDAVEIAMALEITVAEARELGNIHEVKIGPDGGLVVERLDQGSAVHVVGFEPTYQMFEIDRPVRGWISSKSFAKRTPDPALCTGRALPEQVVKLNESCDEEKNIVCENNGACCEGFCVETIFCPSYKQEGERCFDFTTTIQCARGLRCCNDKCTKPGDDGDCPKSKGKRKR